MKRPHPLVLGLLVGVLFTVILNAGSLRAWAGQRLTVADLGAEIGSADEVYYFALMRDARDGRFNFGNTSMIEYRDGTSVAGYALIPQGLLARFTTLELPTIILIGDLLFPALICAFAFLIARRFLRSDAIAAIFALAFMCYWGTGWQRSMNPQVTMTAFLLSLFAFTSDSDGQRFHERGITLFILLLVHPIFAAYMLTIEGLDALLDWKRSQSLISVVRRRWPLSAYLIAFGLLHVGLQRNADPAILAEILQRRGLILSHLPTAPGMQIILMTLLGGWYWLRRTGRAGQSLVLPIALVAGLVVLNQSLLHGRDAVFGLYYRYPLSFVLWLTLGWMVVTLIPRRFTPVLAMLVLAVTGLHMLRDMTLITEPRNRLRSMELRNSGLLGVMEELSKRQRTDIVMGPIDIENLVPVMTPHYALFTQYAHFEYAPDRDLAERYVLQRSLFPLPDTHTVEGHPLVFGIFAGNTYARVKAACKLRLTTEGCDKTLEDFIPDQTLRQFIVEGKVDEADLLQRFGVTSVVSKDPLPSVLQRHCKSPIRYGSYAVYSCSFRPETVSGV